MVTAGAAKWRPNALRPSRYEPADVGESSAFLWARSPLFILDTEM